MNRLAHETSPYLRQHADNPVDWYPWCDSAFDAARERDVPILLSIGYSACHWCHVMAHECFEDDEVAAVMNAGFVNVKVDREERPDIDALYMDALQAATGRGGWPLTAFLTPDGEPFHAGTYFPKPDLLRLLAAVGDVWTTRRDELAPNLAAMRSAVSASAELRAARTVPGVEALNRGVQSLGRAFDREWGGFGTAPKFPTASHLELMLRAYMSTGSELAREILTTSFDRMASGGIYDHIAGGFARYSVDREWLVPHFEKMLPDQALLARTYLHGFMVFGNASWLSVAVETIDHALSEMRDTAGGFYAAHDADSLDDDGVAREGRFATWTPAEVRTALPGADPSTVAAVLEWYGIERGGHLDGRSIPNRVHAPGALIRPAPIEAARRALLAARRRRRAPAVDDKVITEWNAIMLSTLAEAGAVLGRADWLDAATETAEFLLSALRAPDGRWHRTWHRDGVPAARHRALAGDHAALIDAFTRLAEATGRSRWITEAVEVAETLLAWFWDPVEGGLFTTADDADDLIVRQKDLDDGAIGSANSTAAVALLRLAALTGEQRYRTHAERILQLAEPLLGGATAIHSSMLLAVDLHRRGTTEVVVAGERPDLVQIAHRIWRPDSVLAWGERYDSPLWSHRDDGAAYVCRDHVCQLPVTTPEALVDALTTPVTSARGG